MVKFKCYESKLLVAATVNELNDVCFPVKHNE